MAKQPRFTPTEDNNEVVIGEHTVELEVGRDYTKAALLKAFAAIEAEEEVIEAVADELIEEHGVIPNGGEGESDQGDTVTGDGSGEALPEASNEERTASGATRTVSCPKCGARKSAELGARTKCSRCNEVFEAA